MRNVGVISMGIKAPIIREGDNLAKIVVNSVLNATLIDSKFIDVPDPTTKSGWKVEELKTYDIDDKDVIGITESVVARAAGNYVTIDEIALELQTRFGSNKNYVLLNPIYSRNRFSMILKAITRAANDKVTIYMPDADEVGNPSGINPFTGVNIIEYYTELVNKEGKKCCINPYDFSISYHEIPNDSVVIYCGLHDYEQWKSDYGDNTHITLADICSSKCEYGLLGSNKATEEKLKLFPSKESAQNLVEAVKKIIFNKTGKDVIVCIYGDGCFHSPEINGIKGTSINEFADPIPMPGYTDADIIEGRPVEAKLKYYADLHPELNINDLLSLMNNDKSFKHMNVETTEGCTPRRRDALLASLMDLTSGSGDRATPIVLIKNYI